MCVCVCLCLCLCLCVCLCLCGGYNHFLWGDCFTWHSFCFLVSAQDTVVALWKPHTHRPHLSAIWLETVPPLVWLNTDCVQPWRMEHRPHPFSTPLSYRQSVLWWSGLSMFRMVFKVSLSQCCDDLVCPCSEWSLRSLSVSAVMIWSVHVQNGL